MQGKFINRAALGATAAAAAALTLLAGPAQAALQDRDLNGDTVVDAFYDTDLNITWLRDANVNGPMYRAAAVAWADGYSFGGYSDWRLPATDAYCAGPNCTTSEMGHLWYVELGNAGLPTLNAGDFQNLLPAFYWSGTEYPPNTDAAWRFYMLTGFQDAGYKVGPLHAMAVRPGDVAVVPEPQTSAMLLLGLTALAVMRRRRR